MSQKTKSIPESQIPEVEHFLEIKAKVDRLKEAYPEVFEQFNLLATDYNQALEAAEKVVRGKQVSCGPFHIFQMRTSYDADKLHEELGRENFLKMGGAIKTITVYEVDKAKLEAHITSGVIDQEVVDVVRKISPSYKKPEKIGV